MPSHILTLVFPGNFSYVQIVMACSVIVCAARKLLLEATNAIGCDLNPTKHEDSKPPRARRSTYNQTEKLYHGNPTSYGYAILLK